MKNEQLKNAMLFLDQLYSMIDVPQLLDAAYLQSMKDKLYGAMMVMLWTNLIDNDTYDAIEAKFALQFYLKGAQRF